MSLNTLIANIYFIPENITNGYIPEGLELISALAISFGIFTIISKNSIFAVLNLIALYSIISLYLIILSLTFIGLVYIIVYVGAVSILFLFIIMLINIRNSELKNNTKNSLYLAIFIGTYLMSIFFLLENSKNKIGISFRETFLMDIFEFIFRPISNLWSKGDHNILSFVSGNMWDGNITTDVNHMASTGNIIYGENSIWLIIVSIILLLAMTGSIIITINRDSSLKSLGFTNLSSKIIYPSSEPGLDYLFKNHPGNLNNEYFNGICLHTKKVQLELKKCEAYNIIECTDEDFREFLRDYMDDMYRDTFNIPLEQVNELGSKLTKYNVLNKNKNISDSLKRGLIKAQLKYNKSVTTLPSNYSITPVHNIEVFHRIAFIYGGINKITILFGWKWTLTYFSWELEVLTVVIRAIYANGADKNHLSFALLKKWENYWIGRQYVIEKAGSHLERLGKQGLYVPNLFCDQTIFHREVMEDYVYVSLHSLLAKKILSNKNLIKFAFDNNEDFFPLLKSIVENHYRDNLDTYKALNILRKYYINLILKKNPS